MHDKSIHVEITFTGLGILALEKEAESPIGWFTNASIFLVDTRDPDWQTATMPKHRPILVFRARDWYDGNLGWEPIHISEIGEELVHVDLNDRVVKVESASVCEDERYFAPRTVFLKEEEEEKCRPVTHQYPPRARIPCPQDSLDWIPELKEYQLSFDMKKPNGICSQVELPFGSFGTRDLVRDRQRPEQAQLWVFKKPKEEHAVAAAESPTPSRPIANRLVFTCELPLGEPLSISIGNASISLRPTNDLVLPLSITNLPADTVLEPPSGDDVVVHHMKWLAKVTEDPDTAKAEMYLPHATGGLQTIQGRICPYATHLYDPEAE